MTRCWVCGHEMDDNETLYPMPVYDLKPEEKRYDVMGHIMCWDCFSTLVGGLNIGIFTLRNRHITLNRGVTNTETTEN